MKVKLVLSLSIIIVCILAIRLVATAQSLRSISRLGESTSTNLAYVDAVNPGDFVLSAIQQPGGTGSIARTHLLIARPNQDVEVIFTTTGNLKREELDETGLGLGRYDELETTIVSLRIYGKNVFVWSGSIDNFDGLSTGTIAPDGDGKIWMDLAVEATSDPINWSKDNLWYESDDTGLYSTTVTMSIIAVGQPPRPSLEFRPDDAQSSSPSYCVQIYNTGNDDAKNVEVDIRVVKGSKYVSNVGYNPVVDDIENGQYEDFCFIIYTNGDWDSAPSDAEVKLEIKVTREDNWPSHNVGGLAHYTLVK